MTDVTPFWPALRPGAGLPLLVDALLKGTILLLLAFAVTALQRRSAAAVRHLVWSLALGGLLVLPLALAAMPWRLAIVPALPTLGMGEGPTVRTPADGGRDESPMRSEAGQRLAGPDRAPDGAREHGREPAGPRGQPSDGSPARSSPAGAPLEQATRDGESGDAGAIRLPSLPDLLVGIWFLGFSLFLAQWLAAVASMRRIVRRAAPASPEWRPEIERAAARLGLRAPVDVRLSEEVPVPLAFGLLRPVVVLPSEAESWSAERRRTVLLHEFAHLRRADLFTHAVGRTACAVFWVHPLAWIAARRHRSEAERACDDLVLGQGLRPSEYAGHLIDIVRSAGRARTPAASMPMARRSEFEGRLLAILEPGVRRDAVGARRVTPMVGIGALLVLPLAALAPAGALSPGAESGREAELLPGSTVPRDARVDSDIPERKDPSPSPSPSPSVSEAGKRKVGQEARAASRPRVVTSLRSALRDADAGVRLAAVESLAGLGDPGVAEALREALGDASPEVRAAAAGGLGDLEDPRAVEALMRVLREDGDPRVRQAAAEALGEIGDRRAVPALLAALGDESSAVRKEAAWALGELEDPQATEGLVGALADESVEVRAVAAEALGDIGDRRAAEGLARALGDASAKVRVEAAWALGELELTAAPPALRAALEDANLEVRQHAAHTLGHIADPAAVPWLTARLEDESRDVRLEAVEALTEIGDPSAIDALIEAMRDPDAEVRKEAAEALGRGGKR